MATRVTISTVLPEPVGCSTRTSSLARPTSVTMLTWYHRSSFLVGSICQGPWSTPARSVLSPLKLPSRSHAFNDTSASWPPGRILLVPEATPSRRCHSTLHIRAFHPGGGVVPVLAADVPGIPRSRRHALGPAFLQRPQLPRLIQRHLPPLPGRAPAFPSSNSEQ